MTTYTDEVNIYNTDAIAQGIENAENAHKAYITQVSADNGIVVAAQGKGTVNGAITSATTGWHLADVLEFIRQGISRFWIGLKSQTDSTPTVRIGKAFVNGASDNESHMELDYRSLQLVDKDGNRYFHVSDLRDEHGEATITDTWTGDGNTRAFELSMSIDDPEAWSYDDFEVYVNEVETTAYSYDDTSNEIILSSAPSSGVSIKVLYVVTNEYVKAYTFGMRKGSQSSPGAFSVAEGYDSIASAFCTHVEGAGCSATSMYAHAEGRESHATGSGAHAEGSFNHALGYNSHAEGQGTFAQGSSSHAEGVGSSTVRAYSHAQNEGTYAFCTAQTALGTYNEQDPFPTSTTHPNRSRAYGKYAVIVGNGTSDSARSNAAALTWDGALEVANKAQTRTNLGIAAGSISTITVAAGSYVESGAIDISSYGFTSTPTIVVGFYSTAGAGGFGRCSVSVSEASSTSFKVRVFNGDTTQRAPALRWIAVGN